MDYTKIGFVVLVTGGLLHLLTSTLNADLNQGNSQKFFFDLVNYGSTILGFLYATYLLQTEWVAWKKEKPFRVMKKRGKSFFKEMDSLKN